MHILQEIVDRKQLEVKDLHNMYSLDELKKTVKKSSKSFYDTIQSKKANNEHFFITEFKRKSPSEGIINDQAQPDEQINQYIELGANAISVLTDHHYFGGTYDDLAYIVHLTKGNDICILQKDFIIDPIQIYLARNNGAHLILLITRILKKEQLKQFKTIAESLGMGVLVEIHDEVEYEKIADLNFPVIGINNRDLDTFVTRLNHFNYTKNKVDANTILVAESGVNQGSDIRCLSNDANAFLIGTALMKGNFKTNLNNYTNICLLKTCGIQSKEILKECNGDLIGINFSPISKRRVPLDNEWLTELPINAVAVFKNNSIEEIKAIQERFNFKYIQVYLEDITIEFLEQMKCKVILAHSIKDSSDLDKVIEIARYCDLIILDGPFPGSGKEINTPISEDFNYPFLIAGGINENNLTDAINHPYCIGVDLASGIEEFGQVSLSKINKIKSTLNEFSKSITS